MDLLKKKKNGMQNKNNLNCLCYKIWTIMRQKVGRNIGIEICFFQQKIEVTLEVFYMLFVKTSLIDMFLLV